MEPDPSQPRCLVGVAGWSYGDWVGCFYPRQSLAGGYLPYVARYFDLAEINSSFYRPPAPRDAERWARCVDEFPRFRFSAKLWRRFTHDRDAAWSRTDARVVREGLLPLREAGRFSGLLAQFPWSFLNVGENRDWMARVADEFADLPVFIEVRHEGWNRPEFLAWLRGRGIGFVNIDQPALRNCLPATSIATTGTGYFRLHGRNRDAWFADGRPSFERYNYLYSDGELNEIAAAIRGIVRDASKVLVVANNHYRGQAPANAIQLRQKLLGERPRAPKVLVDAFPQLSATSRPDTGEPEPPRQPELFQPTLF